MNYLSIDIEATGLRENDLIIELAVVPFNCEKKEIAINLKQHFLIQCPSFEELKPNLEPWVIEHNQTLITLAHHKGLPLTEVKEQLTCYLNSPAIKKYFNNEKIIILGKSLNAIDLPFLNRDLGFEFMRKYFSHRVLDLSSVAYALVEMKILPEKCRSGSGLMEEMGLGEVCHNALDDAVNTAKIFLKILEKSYLSK